MDNSAEIEELTQRISDLAKEIGLLRKRRYDLGYRTEKETAWEAQRQRWLANQAKESIRLSELPADDRPVDSLDAPIRLVNILRNMGIQTVGQMRFVEDNDIFQQPNCGHKTRHDFKELRDRLFSA